MNPDKVTHWTYWLVTAVVTALVGGMLNEYLKANDPLKVREMATPDRRSTGGAVS